MTHNYQFQSVTVRKDKKNLTFEKLKKNAVDIITLQMCTKNHNHMRYHCEDMG